MSTKKKCFLLHSWRYLDDENRICQKCALVQTYVVCVGGISDSAGWVDCSIDEALRHVEENKRMKAEAIMETQKAEKYLGETQ